MNESSAQEASSLPTKKRIFPSGLVISGILLLFLILGAAYLLQRNNNRFIAKAYAQEIVTSYDHVKDGFAQSMSIITQLKQDLADSVSTTISSLTDQSSFHLYAKGDPQTKTISENTITLVEEKQNTIDKELQAFEQRLIPPGGERLGAAYIDLLKADKALGETILTLDKTQLFFQQLYSDKLTTALNSLDPFILESDTVTPNDYTKIIDALQIAKTESNAALVKVQAYTIRDERLRFIKTYYQEILTANSTASENILAAMAKTNNTEVRQALRDYHGNLYTKYTVYRAQIGTFIAAQILEQHGIPDVLAKEKIFHQALTAYIKEQNLSMPVPKQTISDALRGAIIAKTQKTPSSVMKETRKTYLVGYNAWEGTFTEIHNEGHFDFELIAPNGQHITKDNASKFSDVYSAFDKTYGIYRIKQPLLQTGIWTMIAKGPENIHVSLDGSSQGDDIFVEGHRIPENPQLNQPVLLIGTVHEPELVKDAKIYIRVGSSSFQDDRGVVLLQKVTNFPDIESQVKKIVKPGIDLDAVYVAIFTNTKEYGTYCFDGKAQWTYKTGEPIERPMLTGDGCTIISQSNK